MTARVLAIVIALGSAAPAFSEESVSVGSVRRFFVWPVIFGAIAAIALWRVAETKKTFKRGGPNGLLLTKTDPDGMGRQITMLKSSLEGRMWLAEATREIKENYDKRIEGKDKELKVISHEYELIRERFEHMSAEKRLTESVVRSLSDGLVVVNGNREIKLLNDAAGKILDEEDKTKLVGKRLTDNIKDWQLIAMLDGPIDDDELNIQVQSKSDDVKMAVKSSNAVIEDEYGKMVGMVAVLRNNDSRGEA